MNAILIQLTLYAVFLDVTFPECTHISFFTLGQQRLDTYVKDAENYKLTPTTENRNPTQVWRRSNKEKNTSPNEHTSHPLEIPQMRSKGNKLMLQCHALVACTTGALWAKRGERDISRGACWCRAPREISRSPRLAYKVPVVQAMHLEMARKQFSEDNLKTQI